MRQKDKDSSVESNDSEIKKPNSLSDYIENNSKLISVLGVFTALTVFSYNLTIKPIGNILSFVFLTITIIVWLELWTKFPPKPSSWRLILFENVLSFSVLGIILYWLLAYREIWRAILVFPIWVLTITLISFLITRFNLLEKITGFKIAKYTFIRILFGLTLMILIYFFSLFVSAIISKPINDAFDSMSIDIENIIDLK